MIFFTILILSIVTGAELDLFTPSFPKLQKTFDLSPFMVELMLSVNLVAHCVSAFIAGTLGDRYGRKNIIILGIIMFIIGSILCVFANNYWFLLSGRLLQGVGIAGPAVLSFLVIVDNYSIEEQQHKMGLLNGIVTLAMATAPVIGSYVSLFFKWQGNFILLLLLGIISLIFSILFIPKFEPNIKNSNLNFSIKEYLRILNSKSIFYFIITICLLSQSYWIFIGMSPILYMEDLHVSLKQFGFYQGSICISFAIISLCSGYFIKKFGQKKCLIFGMSLLLLFILATSALMFFNVNNPIIITLVLQLEEIGVVFPINILWPLALDLVPNSMGLMTAIIVVCRLIVTSIGLQIVSYFYKGTFFAIGLAMIISLLLSLLVLCKLLKFIPALDNDQSTKINEKLADFASS